MGGSKSAVHRWYKYCVEAGVFENIVHSAGRLVEERDGYRLYECFIDETFSKARGGGEGVGSTKAGRGVKIMIQVDARGLPVSVDTTSTSPHESKLVQRLFDFMLSAELSDRIIGDKAYDSDILDAELDASGVELIAPHRCNRKKENKTQDGRALRRYKRRWTVERTIAWMQHYRRLCIHWEKSTRLFQGLLHLACTLLLLKEVLGWALTRLSLCHHLLRDEQGHKKQSLQSGEQYVDPVQVNPIGRWPARSTAYRGAAGRCGRP